MSLRVTQNAMYRTMTGQMQRSLSAYMDSNEQGSSQKKINRPSDDPAGTYRVLMTRDDISATKQYQSNVDTAKGWLTLTDNVLSTQVSTVLTRLKSLAEQAATGTYTAVNRQQMAYEAREIFGQFLNLANTEFEGKSIFGGHNYDVNAYEEGLGLCSWDEDWNNAIKAGVITISGASKSSIALQFLGNGNLPDETVQFRWTDDGGEHWHEEDSLGNPLYNDGDTITLDNGVVLKIDISKFKDADGNPVKDSAGNPIVDSNGYAYEGLKVKKADTSLDGPGAKNGTLLYIRPQAIYQGDDNDAPPKITLMGAGNIDEEDDVFAAGTFGTNVLLRMDAPPTNGDDSAYTTGAGNTYTSFNPSSNGSPLYYSYSTDNGSTWVAATATILENGQLHLPVPGGYVDVNASTAGSVDVGAQILVRPHQADLKLEIMKDTYIPINNVGKDIFGGEYDGKPELPEDEDLFGMVGDFIAYLENNNQTGCQRTLERIASVQNHILTNAARVGGLENRVSTAADVLSFQKVDQEERLSYIEDIDLTELLNKLTRQQLTYQTVLQSSSKIMQMSLANYI